MKRGPKPLPPEQKRGKTIGVSATPEEHAEWTAAAKRLKMTVADMVRKAVEEFLRRR